MSVFHLACIHSRKEDLFTFNILYSSSFLIENDVFTEGSLRFGWNWFNDPLPDNLFGGVFVSQVLISLHGNAFFNCKFIFLRIICHLVYYIQL